MASSPVTNIRIDPDLKEQANAVFEELGLTLSTAS
jgi:addiction module RelB/DinJ family antitoxin